MATSYREVESLIIEVQKRPELWDSSLEEYKNQAKKMKAWYAVCRALHSDFDSKDFETKRKIQQSLQVRWKSIRDSNTRSLKKNRGKSGSKNVKKYMFSDLLAFLQPLTSHRDREDSMDSCSKDQSSPDPTKEEHLVEEEEAVVEGDQTGVPWEWNPSASSTHLATSTCHHSSQGQGQKRSLEDAMESFFYQYAQQDEDRDFFNSLLPSVKKLDEDQKLMFRAEVIRVLQAVKAGKLTGSST